MRSSGNTRGETDVANYSLGERMAMAKALVLALRQKAMETYEEFRDATLDRKSFDRSRDPSFRLYLP